PRTYSSPTGIDRGPTRDVVVHASIADGQSLVWDPVAHQFASAVDVTFTTSNWDTPQFVQVTAVNDNLKEGLHFSRVNQSITSDTNLFLGLTPTDVDNGLAAAVNRDVTGSFAGGVSGGEVTVDGFAF